MMLKFNRRHDDRDGLKVARVIIALAVLAIMVCIPVGVAFG